jgi:hypothetical protein
MWHIRQMENARRSIGEMLGDALREIAVLVIVFAPLDRWVERRPYGWRDWLQTFGLGSAVFAMGVLLERTRRV